MVLGSDDGAEALGPFPGHPELLYFLNTSSLLFRGKPVPRTTASVAVQFIGPASINRFLFTIPDLGGSLPVHTQQAGDVLVLAASRTE